MEILIQKSPNNDKRMKDKNISFEEFQKSTDMHIDDVKRVMSEFARMCILAGEKHDWTKKEKEEEFYNQSMNSANSSEFKNGTWYDYHVNTERHHLTAHCPDDVNLIDVLEYIGDCIVAGKARSGHVYPLHLDDEVLQKAFANTVNLFNNEIKTV